MLEISILGCGSSLGVPVVGCFCQVCSSNKEFNKRSRCSILVQKDNSNILIDAGPDIREQLLKNKISKLDAVIITHGHADHINGLDDLRVFGENGPLNVYSTEESAVIIKKHFGYLIDSSIISLQICSYYQMLNIMGVNILLLRQNHGDIDSLGFLIENFAYLNDVAYFPAETTEILKKSNFWLVDCINYDSNHKHAGLDKVMSWVNEFGIKHTYLTNMSHRLDYYKLIEELPANIRPAYDGLKLVIL